MEERTTRLPQLKKGEVFIPAVTIQWVDNNLVNWYWFYLFESNINGFVKLRYRARPGETVKSKDKEILVNVNEIRIIESEI